MTAEQCASLTTNHSDYGLLVSRVLISNHQKNTSDNFFEVCTQLYECRDINNDPAPLLSETFMNNLKNNKDKIQEMFDFNRDFLLDYFGFKTLERAYLMRIKDNILERPQHMWMRVSLGLHGNNIEKVKETYDYMSKKYFTHATPTLFNAGTPSQLSSCYLLAMKEDSINGIYETFQIVRK